MTIDVIELLNCHQYSCSWLNVIHTMTSAREQSEAESLQQSLKQILIAEGRPEGCSNTAVL